MLFYLEGGKKKGWKELPSAKSKTEKLMQWNQPSKKEVTPQPLANINFLKACHGDSGSSDDDDEECIKRNEFDPRAPQDRLFNKTDWKDMLQKLHQEAGAKNCGAFQFWENGPVKPSVGSDQSLPRDIDDLIWFSPEKAKGCERPRVIQPPTAEEREKFVAEMVISQELADQVERMTLGQADNSLWHLLHNGRITSSQFGEISRRRTDTPTETKVAQLMGYKPTILAPALRWGRDNEPRARQAYINHMNTHGHQIVVEECGLHLHPDYSYLGASSDGKVVDSSLDTLCCGCLEIKCAFSVNNTPVMNMTPEQIAEQYPSYSCLAKGDDGCLHLKESHRFYDQVTGEMAVMCVDWCDFVLFTNAGIVVDRIAFDPQHWENTLLPKLKAFYVRGMAEELITGDLWFSKYVNSR